MKNNWFMGACANQDCTGNGDLTSVRFREHQNNFFCWRCESSDEYHEASKPLPKLEVV